MPVVIVPTVTIEDDQAIAENVEDREFPHTVYILVLSTSVNHHFVTRVPVTPIDPLIVIEFVPRARFPPDTVNQPVAVATVISVVPLKDTPPISLAVCNAVAVPALPDTVV